MQNKRRHKECGRWVGSALISVFVQALALDGVAVAQTSEVTVVGARDEDSEPVMQIGAEDLQSYGVSSIQRLLRALRPRIRSSMSNAPPVILINGRLAGQTELQNLPPEAIDHIDVLPEIAALRHGFPDNRRVVNLILREHFRAYVAEALDGQSTEGGRQTGAGDASVIRIDHDTHTTVRADYRENERLLESQRDISAADSDARTLEPALHETQLAATFARVLFGLRPTFEASVDTKSTDSLQGLAVTDSGSEPLSQRKNTTTGHFSGRVSGMAGNFNWTAVTTYNRTSVATQGATGADTEGGLSFSKAHSNSNDFGVESSVGGPFAQLPAGRAFVSADLNVRLQDFATSRQAAAEPATGSHLSRTTSRLRFNTNLPLTSRSARVLPGLGDLAARLNFSAEGVSDFGTLMSGGLGLTWKPASLVKLNVDFNDRRTAPTVENLFNPVVVTPGVQTFDFVTDETAYVTTIAGGNSDLRNAETRGTTVGLSIGPFAERYSFIATYQRRRTLNGIGDLPPTSEALELAFPERFVRDNDGRLASIDARPVNLALEEKDSLRWGVNLMPLPGPPSPKAPPAPFLSFSVFDTWYLHDTLLAREGVPELDFLNGAPTGATDSTVTDGSSTGSSSTGSSVAGTQARHAVEFRVVFNYDGAGVLFNAAWRSASEIDGGTTATASILHFSALSTMNLRLFSDLGSLPLTMGRPWAEGMRVSLRVTNLLNEHQKVRNAAGATPLGFESGYVDPLGRVVSLSVRKLF